ncbi:hypothetical protein M405DRAFT_881076 [Rhizopogon salebrosus TDB-379]|nr:hypothetical protein M405DRAFT_881076 [Rhizopogon salebrosus TDB-379]
MSNPYVRNLTFQVKDLGKETTLLLTFDSDMHDIYKTFWPVVWKVTTFGKSGSYMMHVTYTSQLAFSTLQVENGNTVDASTCVQIKDPQPGVGGYMQAVNETGKIQDIALGFMTPGNLMPQPALYFKDVGDGSHVVAKFTPKLRAYITSDYQESQILDVAILSDVIWEEDLDGLSQSTTWSLERDPASGRYIITQD